MIFILPLLMDMTFSYLTNCLYTDILLTVPRKSSIASRTNTGTNKVNKTLSTIKDLPSPTKKDTSKSLCVL